MPYSKEAKYKHNRQQQPDQFKKNSFRTVDFYKVGYKGEKFKKFHKKGSGAKANRGRKKKSGKWGTQSILTPK